MRSLLRSLGNSPCSMLGHSAASVGATSNKDTTALRSSMAKPSLTDRLDATPNQAQGQSATTDRPRQAPRSTYRHAQLQEGQTTLLPAPPDQPESQGTEQCQADTQQIVGIHTPASRLRRRATGCSRTGQLRAAASKLSRIAICQTRS